MMKMKRVIPLTQSLWTNKKLKHTDESKMAWENGE